MKNRIEYLDAMRGLNMILVVYSHVLGFSFLIEPEISVNNLFITLRMPLFFLLSGFLAYKPNALKSVSDVAALLKKKGIGLLIPTFLFTVIYCLIFWHPFGALWLDKAKCGYWFTLTLFFYFTIYSVGNLTIGRFLHGKWKLLAGFSIALLVYAFSKYSLSANCPWSDSPYAGFWGYANFQYFFFFFLGAVIKAHYRKFEELLDNKWSAFCLIAGFVIMEFIILLPHSRSFIVSSLSFSVWSLLKSVTGIFGAITIFACFRKYRLFFEHSFVGNQLRYIGTRTSDIYFIHLILVHTNLGFIGEFLAKNPSPLMEFVLVLSVSLIVVFLCLIISNILRCSDALAKFLFGKVIVLNTSRATRTL